MKCKIFIPPSHAVARNNEQNFEGSHVLVRDRYLQELRCPSKFKKVGVNPNSSNINRKNLVRSKTQCSAFFKHRDVYAFSALDNNQKESLLENLKVQ